MSRNLMRLYLYICIAVSPLFSNLFFSYMMQEKIEYVNLIPEICFLNNMLCAYTIVTLLGNYLIRNIMCTICLIISVLNITLEMIIYTIYCHNTFVLIEKEEFMGTFWMLIILSAISVILAVVVQIFISENKKDYENKYENYLLKKIDSKKQSNEKQKEAAKSNKVVQDLEPDTDIFAEMLKNYNETREYFKISKFQSKFSFFVSVFAAIAGFIILAVAIYGIIDNEHLEVSIIAAVSGAITEIASVVVLGIHNKSALQLNYYYDALHENEKLLSAINMADKLNADKREEMYIEIIRKQIDIQQKNKEDNK